MNKLYLYTELANEKPLVQLGERIVNLDLDDRDFHIPRKYIKYHMSKVYTPDI